MLATNSYYGFTDLFTPMQKPRVKNQLNKYYYDDKKVIYRFADLAIQEILNNTYTVEKAIITKGMVRDKQYGGKTLGELSKPKTEYRFIDTKTSAFYVINKTQYDFCNYVTETFKTFDEAMNYVEKEAERIRTEKEEKAKEEERITREKQLKKEKREEFKNWVKKEICTYSNNDVVEMCESIFKQCYRNSEFQVHGVSPVIIYVDNINHEKYGERCRNELIEILYNQNKASIKIFERYTNTELPKTYKERIEFLKNFNNG